MFRINIPNALLVCALFLPVSCVNVRDMEPANSAVTVSFTSLQPETKVVFGSKKDGTYPTNWQDNDQISVSYNWGTPVVSSKVSVVDGKGNFTATITKDPAAAQHTFRMVYPNAVVSGASESGFALNLPRKQTPRASSPDRDAMVISASHNSEKFVTSVNDLKFSHLSSYGKMTVTNLPSGLSVSGYTFYADAALSGGFVYDGTTLTSTSKSMNSIVLVTTRTDGIFFSLAPCDLSGKSITLSVHMSDGRTYSRTVSLVGKTLNFAPGEVNAFTINMSTATPDVNPTISYSFAELPAARDNDSWEYHIHDKLPSDSNLRNYSYCFDKDKHCSMWVAWPLHAAWLGDADRTNKFTFDPAFVVNTLEADISDYAYYPQLGSSASHSRGHQMPSADRTRSKEDNLTTFYATNMTPQLQALNGGVWEKLEEYEREWCSDTLYIISGPYFDPNATPTYAYDDKGKGKACRVPDAYWKVFLRVKAGVAEKDVKKCSAGQLQCVAFRFEHDGTRTSKDIYSTDMCSVSEMEVLTGFTFFDNVPNAPKDTYDVADWNSSKTPVIIPAP